MWRLSIAKEIFAFNIFSIVANASARTILNYFTEAGVLETTYQLSSSTSKNKMAAGIFTHHNTKAN